MSPLARGIRIEGNCSVRTALVPHPAAFSCLHVCNRGSPVWSVVREAARGAVNLALLRLHDFTNDVFG